MTELPQAAIDAINAEDSPWPSLADWKAAARTDGSGPDARRKVLLHGAQLAAESIAAAERERIRQLAIDRNASYVIDCGDPGCPGSHAHMADEVAPFAALLTEGSTT